jgi:hypothetical protein
MLTADNTILVTRNSCPICGNSSERLICLPELPMTDTICPAEIKTKLPVLDAVDQYFDFCEDCQFGFLENIVDPNYLYSAGYNFRTSESKTAVDGAGFFQDFFCKIQSDTEFSSLADVGCNDLFLLKSLKQRCGNKNFYGVDPIYEAPTVSDDGFKLFGSLMSDLSGSDFDQKIDVFTLRHTLEHIIDPVDLISRLIACGSDRFRVYIEVPSLEGMLERSRFDQIFHQHVGYYSQKSILRLFKNHNFELIGFDQNYHCWGAMAFAFEYAGPRVATALSHRAENFTAKGIKIDYQRFQNRILGLRERISWYRRNVDLPIFGLGAGQMLPVTLYHLGDEFYVSEIIDDDPKKEAMTYRNLDISISRYSAERHGTEFIAVITATDSLRPLLARAERLRVAGAFCIANIL